MAIYCKSSIISSDCRFVNRSDLSLKYCDEKCFECLAVSVKLGQGVNSLKRINLVLICLYRAPQNDASEFVIQLDKLIHEVKKPNNHIVICGDWNLNFSNSNNTYVKSVRNIFLSFNLHELVDKPTRVTINSKSLLDNVVTDLGPEYISCVSFFQPFSDHEAQLISIGHCFKPSANVHTKRNFSYNNIQTFSSYLAQVDWSFLNNFGNLNEKFERFSNLLQHVFLLSFPTKKVKRNNSKGSLNKDISPGLKALADKNVDLAIMARDSNDPNLKALSKKRQQEFRRLLFQEKRGRISSEVQGSDCLQRAVWNVVRRETQETLHPPSLPSLKLDGVLVNSPSQVVNAFNACFSKSSLISQSSSSARTNPVNSVIVSPINSFFFSPVLSVEIEKAIISLKSKRSCGTDGISSFLLKKIYKTILEPLTILFNYSLSTGIFPNTYKTAKIVPIFKKGDKQNVNNYRPISLLCTISKVFEKIVNIRLLDHLNRHNILVKNQFGFRPSLSTIDAVSEFIRNVLLNLEKREPALGVFCDLSKAFDQVDHKVLCNKLERCGVRGVPLSWFKSYLTNRRQFVEILDCQSELTESKLGVPQGSILGPLLFLVYINDLDQNLPLSKSIFYADDTTLLFGGPRDDLQQRVSESLLSLQNWLSLNNLGLNVDKSVFMQFLTKNKLPDNISLNSFGIKKCSSVKFLGLTVDSSLSWSFHVSDLCKRLSRASFALRTITPLLEIQMRLMVYHGLFASVMSYGVEIWGGSSDARKVFSVQRRAVRIIKKLPLTSSCIGTFRELGLLTLPSLYIFKVIMSTFNILGDLQTVGSGHRYPTRHGGDIRTQRHRLTLSQSEMSSAGVRFFNNLPLEIKACNGKKFKKSLKEFLIHREFFSISDFLPT